MSNQIMKPTSVERMEFIGSMTELINSSGLPPFVIEPILKDMYLQMQNLTIQQYKEDLAVYTKSVKAKSNGDALSASSSSREAKS